MSEGTNTADAVAPATFVELSGAAIVGSQAISEGTGIEVDLTNADGARLSIRLPSGSTQEPVALVRAFRGAAA